MPPAKRGARPQRSTKSAKTAPQALMEPKVSIEIEELADFNETINILIHGPSGHGKTVLAGGAPNAVFLSTEKGVVSAKRAGSKARLIRAPDWEHAVAGVDRAEQELGPDDWLIIDSHTRMQVEYVRWILRKVNEGNPSRDLDIPAIQDHQKWQNGFMRWTDRILDGPYNSIFITTSMYATDPEGEPLVIPQITGKDYAISSYISSQMDVVLYYAVARESREVRKGPITRRALAQPYPPFFAKDRYDALGRWQDVAEGEYFAMADFIGMIYQSLEEVKDAT